MHEALAVIPFFVGDCINLQFLNSNCSYLLSIAVFLVLIALIFFRGILVFGNSVTRIYLKHQKNWCFFQNTSWSRPFLKGCPENSPWSIPPGEFPPGSGLGFGLGLGQGNLVGGNSPGGIDQGGIFLVLFKEMCHFI